MLTGASGKTDAAAIYTELSWIGRWKSDSEDYCIEDDRIGFFKGIPRLELMGAVIGLRVSKQTIKLLPSTVTFWSNRMHVICHSRTEQRL